MIAEGGSGVIISSQSGHRLPALPQEQNEALATTPVDELLDLPFLKEIKVNGNHATLTGRSRVTAAVFGGRRHIWRLQLHFNLSKEEGR